MYMRVRACVSARAHTHTHTHTHTHWEKRLYYFKAITSQNHKVPDLHYQTYSSNLEHITFPLYLCLCSTSHCYHLSLSILLQVYWENFRAETKIHSRDTVKCSACICLLQFSSNFPTLDLYSLQIQKAFHYFTGYLVWWESNSGNYRIWVEGTSFGLACQLIFFCLHWLNFFWDASSN